ncbi:hypothetical protein MTP99_002279 [Tenebrio molitor]|nr:hypothetical protein MTP99_002279 [Tenebrio molitor]
MSSTIVKATDDAGEAPTAAKAQPNKTGKGSRQKRIDGFRKRKNAETDASILAGVFARLKIADPTAVASIPISRETHPVTVPVTFNKFPSYLDRVWDTMQAIGTRPFLN